jgi:hypothetical protein
MEGLILYTFLGSLDLFEQLEDSRGSSRGSGLIPLDLDSLWFGSSVRLVFCLPLVLLISFGLTLGLTLVCSIQCTIRSFTRPPASTYFDLPINHLPSSDFTIPFCATRLPAPY